MVKVYREQFIINGAMFWAAWRHNPLSNGSFNSQMALSIHWHSRHCVITIS